MHTQGNDNATTDFDAVKRRSVESHAHFEEATIVDEGGCRFVAKAKRYGRWWALIGLKTEYRDSNAHIALLRKKFDAFTTLQHPGIASVFAWERVEGFGECIVMEWTDATTLREWLATKPERSERHRIAQQLTDALEYAHEEGTPHGSLSAESILITPAEAEAKLIGFGETEAEPRNDIRALGSILADLRLGWMYAPIAHRCKAERGYQSVKQVKRAFRRIKIVQRAAVAFVLLILFVGSLTLSPGEAPRDERIYATADSLRRSVAENKSRTDSMQRRIDTLRANMMVMDNKLQRWIWREKLPTLAIEEGRRKLSRASRWNLDTLATFEQCDSFYFAALHSLALVYRTHIRQLPLEITDWDMENIRDELTAHYNACMLPVYKKTRDLATKESDAKELRDNGLREATCEEGKKYLDPRPTLSLDYIVMDYFLYREKNSAAQKF